MTEVIEVAGFDGQRCTMNTVMELDESGAPRTLRRLEQRHARQLGRSGFDDAALGGAFR